MPKPKRYTSREMVLKDIDKAHRKIKRLKAQTQTILDAVEFLNVEDAVERKNLNESADELLAKISRIENTRLVKLGKTLAMFDTIPLGAEGLNQQDVCLQRI